MGAAVVGLAWLFLGGGSNSGASGSLASLGQAPGIAPPDYAYLDTAQVALYLGQLEGGTSTSEQLTQQLTQSRTAGLGAGSLSLGGSSGSQSTAERVVSPTATARFYQLLDLLGRDGYLHKIDAAASPAELRRAFAKVPEGAFVELDNCNLQLPRFVRLEQLSRTSKGTSQSAFSEYETATAQTAGSSPTSSFALTDAKVEAGRQQPTLREFPSISPRKERRLAHAIEVLDKAGANPRVPLSTCNGATDLDPRGVDLLFPIHLANLSSEQSLLAGPVTLVGKLVRAVRTPREDYVDDASLATYEGPVLRIDYLNLFLKTGSAVTLGQELDADAVVLAPGAVILPIAIYK